MPTLIQMKYFICLAENNSFTRAANKLNITQPPLSRAISAIEDEYGVKLFDRLPHSVEVTPKGKLLLDEFRVLLRKVENIKNNIQTEPVKKNIIKIGFTMCAAFSIIPIIYKNFTKDNPLIELKLVESTPLLLMDSLNNGDIDFVISFPEPHESSKSSMIIYKEPLELCIGDNFVKSKTLSVKNALELPLVIIPKKECPVLWNTIISWFHSRGINPKIGIEVKFQQTIVNLVSNGIGIAFLPKSIKKSLPENISLLKINEPPIIAQLLYWDEEHINKVNVIFIDYCKKHFETMCISTP